MKKNNELDIQKIIKRITRSAIKTRENEEFDNNIYTESAFESMLEDDEITVEEAWFMQGWGHAFDKLNRA